MLERYAPTNPKIKTRLSLHFAFSSIAHCLATFFGSGLLRPASGTFGTAAGWIVYCALFNLLGVKGFLFLIVATFFIGAWACEVSGKDCGVHDHSSFVIDEVFAIWMVLLTLPPVFIWQLFAFLAFRFFDIVKLRHIESISH